MNKWIVFVAALCLQVSVAAAASPADTIKGALTTAREKLLAMLEAPDVAAMDKLQAEIAKATKSVDAGLTAALADKAAPADKYNELKATWEQFKKTRDSELIPALRAGKKDEAKAIAKGVQAERFAKMQSLLTALGAK